MVTLALLGVLITASCAAVAVVGLLLAHRLLPLAVRKSNNAATGAIYAAVYVMFGVTLGFSLLLVWQEYEAARQTAEAEAAAAEELHSLAGQLPEPARSRVRDAAVSYVRVVVQEEWPAMKQGRASPRAGALADDLRESVQGFEPGSAAEGDIYASTLTQMGELDDARALRLLEVREGLPPLLWVVLIVGATVTVSFTFLFGMDALWLHAVATAALAVLVVLILCAISVLEYPFDGDLQVGPEAFELALRALEAAGR